MIKIVKSIEIRTPPAIIWTIIVKHLEHPEQPEQPNSELSHVRGLGGVPLSQKRTGIGVRTRWTYEFRGKRFAWDDEVTGWEEGRLIAWKATSKWAMLDSFELLPTEAGTTVFYRMQYRFPYGVLGWLAAKLFYHRHIEQSLEKTLRDLKSSAERINSLKTTRPQQTPTTIQ